MNTLTGPAGTAVQLPILDRPKFTETVDWWLVTSTAWVPLWSQWFVALLRLRDDAPGFPPPHHQFEGSTHEVLVLTINPDIGTLTPEQMLAEGWALDHLQPQNVCLQFEGTDAEMRQVLALVMRAVVDGSLPPESWAVPGGNRELDRIWLQTITKTLAHLRGEEHAP